MAKFTYGNGPKTILIDANGNTYEIGNGNDTITFEHAASSNTVTAGNGNDSITFGSAASSNTVTAGNGSDTITFDGGADDNVVTLGNGNDTILDSASFDTVTAGNGNDTIRVGGTADTVTVGNGNDSIVVGGDGGDSGTVTAGNGDHTVTLTSNALHGTVTLGNGTATVTDSGVGNTIKIGNGAATVTGAAGDTITLGTGHHAVDVLSDIITIGAGTDSFVFDRKTGAGSGTNFSTITGFDARHDSISISKSTFDVTGFSDLTIKQSGANAMITNAGHSGASLSITLTDTPATALHASDFKFT